MRCANLTAAIRRARSRFDVDDDGDVDADDFNARFRMIADLNVTAADCTTLELSEVECEQLRNFTARVHSRLDIDNDGDIDGADANLRFRLIAALNITATDCMRLELTEDACTRLSNITSRARSRLEHAAIGSSPSFVRDPAAGCCCCCCWAASSQLNAD